MPYIIITSYYPSEKAPEVAKKYIESLEKYPPDESLGTMVVPTAVKSTLDGVQGIGITKVKEGQLEKALKYAVSRMAMLMPIPGFEYTIETHYTVVEALEVIGMSPPK